MDVQPTNQQPLCDAIISIWTKKLKWKSVVEFIPWAKVYPIKCLENVYVIITLISINTSCC